MNLHHVGVLDQVHIALALGITAAYFAAPFTRARLLPMTRTARTAGGLFFVTCALTHLTKAAGYDSHWLIIPDAVQLISITTFLVILDRMMAASLRRQAAIQRHRHPHAPHHDGVDADDPGGSGTATPTTSTG